MNIDRSVFKSGEFWDKSGVAVSWACAAHCLLMPLIVSFLPLLGFGFLADEMVEYIFIGLSAAVGLVSLLPGFFRFHRNIAALVLFVAGLACLVLAEPLLEDLGAGKLIFVILGASLLTAAHLFNRRWCRSCRNCAETECRSTA